MPNTKETILDLLKTVKAVNSHCHHLSAEAYAGMDLPGILRQSYCGWMDDAPQNAEQAETYIRKNACNSYFRWMFTALEKLYGLPFTAENYDEIARRVKEAHADPAWQYRILEEKCGYEKIMLDYYENPGFDLGRPRLFEPVLRCNMLVVGNAPGVREHTGVDPFAYLGRDFDDFDEYLSCIRDHLKKYKAIKFAIAYDWDNDIRPAERGSALEAFHNENATTAQRKAYYDYMVFRLCEMAGATGIAVQFHTGLGRLDKSSPLYLRELVEALPEVKFDLFHGGFPWTDDMLAMLHNYKNVWADICWMPLLSMAVARRFLREALEVGGAHRIVWGCDTWTSEESYGALLAGRDTVASALAELCDEGAIDEEYALYIAKRIWLDNGMELYGLGG